MSAVPCQKYGISTWPWKSPTMSPNKNAKITIRHNGHPTDKRNAMTCFHSTSGVISSFGENRNRHKTKSTFDNNSCASSYKSATAGLWFELIQAIQHINIRIKNFIKTEWIINNIIDGATSNKPFTSFFPVFIFLHNFYVYMKTFFSNQNLQLLGGWQYT